MLKRILLKNIGLKLLALAFATALWFLVVGEKEVEVGFIVPLGFKGVPDDMVMVGTPPGDVEVRVVGPKAFVNNLSPAQITADIDLSESNAGLNTFRLQPGDIKLPRGLEVARIRPSSVVIWMERLLTLIVPVEIQLEGKPDPGYRVSTITAEPSFVTLQGIKEDVQDIKKAVTMPVSINGLNYSKSETVYLELSDKKFSSIEPDVVVVTVDVEAAGKKK